MRAGLQLQLQLQLHLQLARGGVQVHLARSVRDQTTWKTIECGFGRPRVG